jgi:hypothetical protein
MTDGKAGRENLDFLFAHWSRLEEIHSLGVGSADVQRHLRLRMDELENRMLLLDPQRTARVIAHHAATRAHRKAA